MKYTSIVKGIFLKRPNRFIAHVLINGVEEIAHVKNTGRCKELLLEGVTVYLEPSTNPERKTKFSLVAVEKGSLLINMDSQAPNKILGEALSSNQPIEGFPYPLDIIKPEYTYGNSRLDFYLEKQGVPTLVEVKGVTLEKNGAVFFPDAPTERGIKHINELSLAISQGYHAIICFIIQLEQPTYFAPNNETHPAFGKALQNAQQAGVQILAFDCNVTPQEITLGNSIPVKL